MNTLVRRPRPVNAQDSAANHAPGDQTEAEAIQSEKDIRELARLAAETLEPEGMLAKYARLGRKALELARRRRASVRDWSLKDYSKLCRELEDEVRQFVSITSVRMDLYIRVAAFVDAIRPLVADIETLAYFQVANKFLRFLRWSPVDLEGEIREESLTFVRCVIQRQVGDDPLPIKELDAAIAAHKQDLERERSGRIDPDRQLRREQRAIDTRRTARRNKAATRIMETVSEGIRGAGLETPLVVYAVEQALAEHGLKLPTAGFDPARCTVADCRLAAEVMYASGKLAEMKQFAAMLERRIAALELEVPVGTAARPEAMPCLN